MTKNFTQLQGVAIVTTITTVFSALSGWYGFMFGRESSRRQLDDFIETLKNSNSNSSPRPPRPPHSPPPPPS